MTDGKTSPLTPSQTVGPYFKYGLTPGAAYAWNDAFGNNLITPDAVGERIRVEGVVYDGDGKPITDSMLEIWQADSQGRYAEQTKHAQSNAAFRGFGRVGTDANGLFVFDTVKPGQVADPDGKMQAPHIVLAVFARGMTQQCMTRIYFEEEASNATCPVLALVPAERRNTLIAKRNGATYRFDVHLQGDDETVFFDV